jgi:hypothetical protein
MIDLRPLKEKLRKKKLPHDTPVLVDLLREPDSMTVERTLITWLLFCSLYIRAHWRLYAEASEPFVCPQAKSIVRATKGLDSN